MAITKTKLNPQQRAEQRKGADGLFRQVAGGSMIRTADAENRIVEFIASDGSVDAYGTVLPVSKWDLARFKRNPVVGYQHAVYGKGEDKSDPDNIIGKGDVFVRDGLLIIRVTFEPAELNPKADKIFRKVLFGTLNGVSVGFTPTKPGHIGVKSNGEDPNVFYYDGQELLEVSVVNIPANPNAVKRQSKKADRAAVADAAARAVLAQAKTR